MQTNTKEEIFYHNKKLLQDSDIKYQLVEEKVGEICVSNCKQIIITGYVNVALFLGLVTFQICSNGGI